MNANVCCVCRRWRSWWDHQILCCNNAFAVLKSRANGKEGNGWHCSMRAARATPQLPPVESRLVRVRWATQVHRQPMELLQRSCEPMEESGNTAWPFQDVRTGMVLQQTLRYTGMELSLLRCVCMEKNHTYVRTYRCTLLIGCSGRFQPIIITIKPWRAHFPKFLNSETSSL